MLLLADWFESLMATILYCWLTFSIVTFSQQRMLVRQGSQSGTLPSNPVSPSTILIPAASGPVIGINHSTDLYIIHANTVNMHRSNENRSKGAAQPFLLIDIN